MMIAKAKWKVVGDVRAKLSLVVSLGISMAVEGGSLFITLGPKACPSCHNQGPSWPEKARLFSGVGFARAELMSQLENAPNL